MKRIRPAILLIENNHVLLMQYQYGEKYLYNFPGGNMDPGETMPDTVIRECREELGIDVEIGQLALVAEIKGDAHRDESIHPIFFGRIIGGIPEIQKEETISSAVSWLKLDDLKLYHLYPNISNEITDILITGNMGKYIGEISQPWI